MNLEENMYNHENNLSKFASLSKNAIRLKQEESDIRPAYFRDIDRIIYSLSYTRYIDKTQVFSLKENDHISKRIIHVQFVSKIAKTIGRALGLNEDLIEAIALGHDLGHVPFGHVGEKILNDISLKYDNTYFNHNAQSVRELMSLEKNGQGLNITIQVLDGILCHNGEFLSGKYIPKEKSVQNFLDDYNNTYLYQMLIAMSDLEITLKDLTTMVTEENKSEFKELIILYLNKEFVSEFESEENDYTNNSGTEEIDKLKAWINWYNYYYYVMIYQLHMSEEEFEALTVREVKTLADYHKMFNKNTLLSAYIDVIKSKNENKETKGSNNVRLKDVLLGIAR